ncbi:MAG: HAD family phosphatase [Clostridia bacterium]|nr:HAD family phosphatase [Clostridia bacterium]
MCSVNSFEENGEKMKTFLFDFDGTLVDSMPTFVSAMLRILDENGVSYSDDIIKIITPLGLSGTADYYINTLKLNKTKEELITLMGAYMLDAYRNTIPAKKNVIEVLKALKERGDSLNVLTASPHLTLDACLKRLNIYDLFDNVWSCDDFNTTKANPEIYVSAAKKLNKQVDEVWFLDDNLGADTTAKTAGMKVCGVYDATSSDYANEIKAISDYYIYDFSELFSLPEK